MSNVPATTRQLRSLVTEDGQVRVSVETVDTPQPQPHQVLVRVEAAPLNPSDLALLLALADPGTAKAEDTPDGPVVSAPVPEAVMPSMRARLGRSMPVGNEGAGVVVAAGDAPEAQALLGKQVGFPGEGTCGEHALTAAQVCLPLPEGATAAEGAASFVNPFTALGMVETMRREGHSALVHTAAASNLGQMLNRVCLADGIELVNVVRRPEQADL
ncbi:MAG: alcohol dehydrogenase catalytic domain-containing protein, partial [Nocardioides sp.]